MSNTLHPAGISAAGFKYEEFILSEHVRIRELKIFIKKCVSDILKEHGTSPSYNTVRSAIIKK
ncbi:MAG: hypothetical protein ABIH00_11390 [Armatimonadota bacterium]